MLPPVPHVSDEDFANALRCLAMLAACDLEIAAIDAQLELPSILGRDQRIAVQRFEKALDVAHHSGIGIGRVARERVVDELSLFHGPMLALSGAPSVC